MWPFKLLAPSHHLNFSKDYLPIFAYHSHSHKMRRTINDDAATTQDYDTGVAAKIQ